MRYIELNPIRADMVVSPVIKRLIQDSRLDPVIFDPVIFASITSRSQMIQRARELNT